MPKLVDYAARFEFLREAAFLVVRDEGPASLSRRRVAAELGTSLATVRRLIDASAPLASLAADEVATRRRHDRWRRPVLGVDTDPLDRALHLVSGLLPTSDTDLAVHLVWLKLGLARPTVTARARAGDSDRDSLATRFQVADRGWSDEPSGTSIDGAADTAADTAAGTADVLEQAHAAHTTYEEEVLHEALALVRPGDHDHDHEVALLTAAVHGLSLDVVLGTLSPREAAAAARHLLTTLSRQDPDTPPDTN